MKKEEITKCDRCGEMAFVLQEPVIWEDNMIMKRICEHCGHEYEEWGESEAAWTRRQLRMLRLRRDKNGNN
jgi:ribosomal protein L37E